jgi:hypothetical protein
LLAKDQSEVGFDPKIMMKYTITLLLAGLLAVPLAQPSFADDHHDHGRSDHHEQEHHETRGPNGGRFDHRFADRDWDHWRGGHWFHGRHEDRDGWWWVIGGSWYFYPAPTYPYPDPATLPAIAAPTPATVVPAPAPSQTCREYHGDAIINDTNQPFYGTACLESDGQWHIVSR